MADFKRHTARQLLDLLEKEKAQWLLPQLRYHRAWHKTESEHQVWQEGFHPQSIPTDEIMLQKRSICITTRGSADLLLRRRNWRYSSAHGWVPGAMPLLRCDE